VGVGVTATRRLCGSRRPQAYADRRRLQAQRARPCYRVPTRRRQAALPDPDARWAPFSFAGLWERWKKGKTPIETFTIITGEPNSLTSQIHDRMPVILDPVDYCAWLTASNPSILL
jgi:hypothetical protein